MMNDVGFPVAASPSALGQSLVANVADVVLGQREEIELVVAGLLAGGHVLLDDVPGVGKTLLAKSLAASLGAAWAGCRARPT